MKRLPSIAAVTGEEATAVMRAVPRSSALLRRQFAALFGLALLAAVWAMSPAGKPRAVHVWTISAPSGSAAPGAKWIGVESAGRKFVAAVFRPEGRGPFPVVVALHGAGGIQDRELEVAAELARHGFLVIAGCRRGWRSSIPFCAQATPQGERLADPAKDSGKELIAAVRYLPAARADRVALYAMAKGGHAALSAAGSGAQVRAVVVDYTADSPAPALPTPTALEIPGRISVPVLLMHGTSSPVISVERTREHQGTAREGWKPVDGAYFDGGSHVASAQSETRPEAIQRAVAFLRKHLG